MRLSSALMVLLVSVAILAGSSTTLSAGEILSNQDVINLIKAGINEDLVKRKITSSDNDFDVSAEAMVTLRKEGVPDEIIGLMLTQADKVSAKRERRLSMSIQSLTSDREETRQSAFMTLLRLGNSAKDEMLDVLTNSNSPALRAAVADALARMEVTEAVPVLAVLLDHPDRDVRRASAKALAMLDEARSRKLAAVVIEEWGASHSGKGKPVDAYLRLAGMLDMKDLAMPILAILQESSIASDREEAARTLGKLKVEAAEETLKRTVSQDRSAPVRAAAAIALARQGTEEGADVLMDMAINDKENREVIFHALASFPPHKVVPMLITVMSEELTREQEEALLASLRRLTHQDFGTDRARWLVWWEKNEEELAGDEKDKQE